MLLTSYYNQQRHFYINVTYFNKKRYKVIITKLIEFINILLLLFQNQNKHL